MTTTRAWTVWRKFSPISAWDFLSPVVPLTEDQALKEAARMQRNLREGEWPNAVCEARPNPNDTPEKAALVQALLRAFGDESARYARSVHENILLLEAALTPKESATEAEMYYIVDTRTIVGNCALFWCPDGKGYTTQLEEAGLYTKAEAMSHRPTDLPVPASLARAHGVTHVRVDRLREVLDQVGLQWGGGSR